MRDRSRRVRLHAANVYKSIPACSPSKMSLAKKRLATLVSALFIMCPRCMESSRDWAKRGNMLNQISENETSTQERRIARVIHSNLSYIVQGPEHGTDGALVLLHDIIR